MSASVPTPVLEPGAASLRTVAGRAILPLMALVALGALLQVAFAGGGAFGAGVWAMHRSLGMFMTVPAILVVVAAVLARPGRSLATSAVVALVLTLFQPIAAVAASRVDPAFGLLHGLGAAILFAYAAWVVVGSSRR